MSRLAQVQAAKRLLAFEGADGTAEACAAAAGRVYEKLQLRLASLLGPAVIQMMFARSAKLTQDEFPCFADGTVVDSSASLRACLQALEPAAVEATAAALFGAFLTLIMTLIGEQLTTEVLRRTWPAIEARASKETKE